MWGEVTWGVTIVIGVFLLSLFSYLATFRFTLVIGIYNFLVGILLFAFCFQVILTFSVVKGVKAFRGKGVAERPFIWAILMLLPSFVFVYPLYLVRSKITWPKQIGSTGQ